MNITVKANNKVNVIKAIKLVLLDMKEKNKEYIQNGVIMELAQTIDQLVNSIYRTSNDEYIANVIFYSKPLYYNYHGIVSDNVISR